MLTRIGRFTVRRRKAVLITTAIVFVLSGVVGGGVAKHLSAGGFEDPNSESAKAQRLLEDRMGQGVPNLVLLITARHGTVDDPAIAAEGRALTARLAAEPGVAQAASYWSLGSPPPLKSTRGDQALVLARISGSQNAVHQRVEKITPEYTITDANVTVRVGGFAEVFRQVSQQIQKDLATAEAVAIPITIVCLILVFGGLVAAALPLGIGGLAIVGTFLVLRAWSSVTEVSIFSLNLATAMGLGLAIDYSLFIVSRYREELTNGLPPGNAIVRTVETAGRTVLFSAMTVASSLAALIIFPLAFLRSFAYAGIGVVLMAAAGAVLTLPALLAVLGRRIDRFVLWKHTPKPVGEGMWHRIATFVMRRPIVVSFAVVALLLVLGAPFLNVRFGLPDDRVLPPGAPGRVVTDQLRHNFSANEATAMIVVAPGTDGAARAAEVDGYAAKLSALPGVGRVDAITGSYVGGTKVIGPLPSSARFRSPAGTWLSVVQTVEPMSGRAEALVREVRAVARPFPVRVGGPSAQLVDSKHSLFGLIPIAGGIIALVTFVVLFLMTGSVLVPIKALVLNILSLTATFGVMVWIFQEGHFAKALNFTATGLLDTTTPILMFCIAFGLSMDFEVFLLSRIKEEHDKGADNITAVAIGLERTGRIVTAAAGLIAIVFIANATSQITFIKIFGLGLTMAVVMDATLIRGALVPAFMRLAGNANWWAPKPLRRLHDRIGFREAEPAPARIGGATPEDAAPERVPVG
ncbi:MAG: Integral rane protein [Acidimicrobiales bacterium]|nr:Integral rane protein [Acidimicrobiales bacterium]